MKRLLLPVMIAFLSASGTQLAAQPTLTATSNNLQIGDQFQVHLATIGAPEFAAGALAGANQTWNFSTLASMGLQQVEVLSRAAAPKPTDYPAANMVVKVGSEYAYLENNNSILKEHADYESMQNYSLENTDPAEKLHFPFQFNDTFSDAYTGAVNAGGTTIPRNGTVTVTAEGYGTLITPSGTYQNVLKVKTEEVSNAGTLYSEITTTYDWFQAGTHFPVFRMTKRAVTLLGTTYTGIYLDVTLGIKEDLAAEINLQVLPNPADKAATIRFDHKKSGPVKLQITNLLGQEIQTISLGKSGAGLQTCSVDVSGYARGIYLIKVEIAGKVAVRRLLVQ